MFLVCLGIVNSYPLFLCLILVMLLMGVAMTTVFMEFTTSNGPLGVILEQFGIKIRAGGLLQMPETALQMVMAYVVWTGFTSNVLLFGGSFSRIPVEVLEAAKIDGCGFWREAFKIIVPMVWPMFSTMIVLSCTSFMACGGQVLLLTDGADGTITLNYWMFKQVYGTGSGGSGMYGTVSAAGMCFSAVLIPLTLFIKWVTERIPSVES